MRKTGLKLRSAGVVFALVLAVISGACGTQAETESSKQVPVVEALSSLASDVASGIHGATDSMMAKLGFGPADAGIEAEASATPPEVVRPAPRPTPTPPVVPIVMGPEPLETGSSLMAIEAPAPIAAAVYEIRVQVEDSIIYSAADLDVVPPISRSVDLPSWRPSDGPDGDAVEVVISREGSVDRIRLLSEPRRMIDTMTLSAAKMWKFEPALKDGAPVRYRLVLQSPRAASHQ